MNLGHSHETKFWYLKRVFSKFSDEHPRHFYRGVSQGGGGGLKAEADNTNSISNTTQMKWKKNNIKDKLNLQQ